MASVIELDHASKRFGGTEAIHEFAEMRSATVQSAGRSFPF